MVRPITFDKQHIKSQDDAHIRNVLLEGEGGITKGCDISYLSDSITISKGYFCAFGRWVAIDGEEVIAIDGISSGRRYCVLVYTIDLTKENTEDNFAQGKFEILKGTTAYPSLRQENLDSGGEVYQLEFARFVQTLTGITEFKIGIKNIVAGMVTKDMIAHNLTTTKEGYVLGAEQATKIIAAEYKELSTIDDPLTLTHLAHCIEERNSITLSCEFETRKILRAGETLLDFAESGLNIRDTPFSFNGRYDAQPSVPGETHIETYPFGFKIENNKLINLKEARQFWKITIDSMKLLKETHI